MNASVTTFLQVHRKNILIALAALFLCIGLARFAVGIYQETSSEIEAKESILLAQQKSSRQLAALKKEVALLEQQKQKAETFLFHGPTADSVTSTMQIRLQTLIAEAGLEPESLRPLGGKSQEGGISTINIKLRLNGTLDNFAKFLNILYGDAHFFLIESCTIKPDSTKGLKIFMDIKTFYDTRQNTGQDKKSSQRRSP